MRRRMLEAKVQNENCLPFTTDSIMKKAAGYYDRHGSDNERMMAHYLLGCTYRDLGDAPRALQCYNDAVSRADTTSPDCDYTTMSRIYGQMAVMFSDNSECHFVFKEWYISACSRKIRQMKRHCLCSRA